MAAENFKVKKGLEVGTGSTITSGGINVTGVITATQLVGDGSGLTNVVGSGSGIVVKDEGSAVGTAGTINFVGSGVVASLSAGQATVTISSGGLNDIVGDTTPQLGGNLDLNNKNINGNGKVLVGTTSGNNANKIHARAIDANIPTTSNQSVIFAENDTNAWITIGSGPSSYGGILFADSGSSDIGQVRYNHGTNSFEFLTNGGNSSNVRLTINSTGTVGITSGLSVSGVSTLSGNCSFAGNNVTMTASGSPNSLNASGTSRFEIASMENALLDGSISHTGDATTQIQFETSTIKLDTAGTTRLNINNSGVTVTGVSTFNEGLFIPDTKFLRIGNSVSDPDLLIAHDANSNTVIENKVGALFFKGTGSSGNIIHIQAKNNVSSAIFNPEAAALLHFNGTQKLETTGTGIAVPNISVSGVGTFSTRIDTNGVSFGTNSTTFAAKFLDDAVINVGTNNDLKIYHDDGNGLTYIRQDGTGPLDIRSINDINIRDGNDGDLFIECKESEGVKLYYEGSEKLEVTNHGAIVTGVCTATSFSGDGSGLTGVTASGTGIVIQHDGSNVGTAGTINFSTNLDVTPISAGIVTVTASGGSSATNTISQGNSSVEVIGSGTDDGEFKILLQDNTAIGAGKTAFRMYQPSASATFAEFFEENTAISSLLGLNATYGGNTAQTIRFATSNSNFMQRIVSETASGQMYFRTKYNGTDYTPLQIGTTIIYTKASVNPLTDNTYDLGYSAGGTNLWWRQLRVHNINVGIVTATTRFVGSGVSLTSLNADELDSGTIPNGRFPATLPAVSGANLTNLPVPTQITVADESSDQTCNILFTTAATGDLAPKSNSTLTYDANGEVLSATLFSGSGASLTNLNASNIGSGTMSASRLTGALPAISGASLTNLTAANLTGALPAISGASLTNLPAPTPTTSDIQVTYEITNQTSFSYYRFAGNGVDSSANNPDIYLERGQKYRFINNSGGTNHPFQIQTTGGTAYNTGVTNNNASTGSASKNIDFAVRWDAPSQLKYQCTNHGSMQGNIYISGGESGRRTTAAAATGSIANAAAANISITAAKTYSLLKVQTSAAAWVTLYTDSTSRSNDASRGETTDPTPGSGVIAEVITSGAATQILSPGVIGWNNDSTPSSTVYAKVVNKSGSTQAITVTLHYLQMEI